jgi:hypothetical protein
MERNVQSQRSSPGSISTLIDDTSRKLRQQFKARGFVLGLGIILMVVAGLFPPWEVDLQIRKGDGVIVETSHERTHAFLFSGPQYCKDTPCEGIVIGVKIDFAMLLLEWLIIGLVMGGLIAMLQKDGTSRKLFQKFRDRSFVLRVGVGLIVITGLFPPWMVKTFAEGTMEHPIYGSTMVYAFLFTGPSIPTQGVSLSVLFIELAIIALVMGVLIATLPKAEKENSTQ